ncbi:MAG: Periplasmic protease [Chthonomonadaceae bacterium]|nr:Periplasmic protease [Chthonomonadaceae bacterium]
MRFPARLLALSLVVAALGTGFLYGHALGAHGQGKGARLRVGRLFPFSKPTPPDSDNAGQEADESVPPANVYEDVLDHVQKEFVETNATSNARLSNGSLSRMFAALDDPHTFYLDAALRKSRQQAFQGLFHGIGAVLTVTRTQRADVEYRHLTIVDVMSGSPAERAGLQSGDNITEIDGHWIIAYSPLVDEEQIALKKEDETARHNELQQVRTRFQRGYALSTALPLLISGEGKPLQLRVERSGRPDAWKVHLTTAAIEVDPVAYRTAGKNIGYLQIRQFNPRAAAEIRDVLGKLDPTLRGLIVDLRSNPGGVRSAAEDATDGLEALKTLLQPLTSGGAVALLERRPAVGKQPPVRETVKLLSGVPHPALAMAVLVDHGTANLAEVAAQALNRLGDARIVGSHTFGDDRLPFFGVLKSGGGVEMTTAHLLSPDGLRLNRGLEPALVTADRNSAGDPALQRATLLLTATGE